MRKGLILAAMLACLTASGCAVNTIGRCVDHPFVCAGIGAGVAGGFILWQQGYLDFENLP